ncbi:MAG: Lpg1974 family pore-forming outer membrane protein [Candidatus Cryosericum sp.]
MWQTIFVALAVAGQTECTECTGHWVGYAEYVNWQARSSGWTTPAESIYNHPELSQIYWEPLAVEPERNSGIRAGFGRQFANGWEATWNYTNFSADGQYDRDDYGPNYIMAQPRDSYYWLGGNVHLRSEINYGVHDLELAHCFQVTETLNLHIMGGFRWARMAFARSAAMLDAGTRPIDSTPFRESDVSFSEQSHLDAYGLRLGAQADWRLGPLTLFGRGAVSGLYATGEDYTTFEPVLPTPPYYGELIFTNWNRRFSQATGAIEVAAGLSFTYRCVEIAAGYELSTWLGVLPDSMHGDGETEFHDLVLDGLFTRVTCRY